MKTEQDLFYALSINDNRLFFEEAEKGFNPFVRNEKEKTLLEEAIDRENGEVVFYLVKNDFPLNIEAKGLFGESIYLDQKLRDYPYSTKIEVFKILLEEKNYSFTDEEMEHLWFSSDLNLLRWLIDIGYFKYDSFKHYILPRIPSDETFEDGSYCLDYFLSIDKNTKYVYEEFNPSDFNEDYLGINVDVAHGDLEKIKRMVERGAILQHEKSRVNLICTALLAENYKEVIDYLLSKGVPINKVVGNQDAVLGAIQLEDLRRLKYLESKGVDIGRKMEGGNNIIHYAAEIESLDILKYGISKGIEFDHINDEGYTPLLIATIKNKFKAAKFLIEKGTNKKIEVPDKGMALDYYVIEGTSHSKEWIDLFLKH